ncbi:hypothetical protein C8R44DRAFT_815760 [Mycena epipterygia]|nr:hypothetical protein C8R44DRAFT_815760 [Mycena epipterygia]
MSILTPFKLGAKITGALQAQPGQLVYSTDRTSITACFYELLASQGLALWPKELDYLESLHKATRGKFGRPCIILDRLPDRGYTVCFIAQIRGAVFSPIGRFFGARIGSTSHLNAAPPLPRPPDLSFESSTSFAPLRLTDVAATGPRPRRFYLYGIPVVRDKIQLFPGEPRHLIDGDLQRAIEMVRGRVMACSDHHPHLRRDQLRWFRERETIWRHNNPQEGGLDMQTYLRM